MRSAANSRVTHDARNNRVSGSSRDPIVLAPVSGSVVADDVPWPSRFIDGAGSVPRIPPGGNARREADAAPFASRLGSATACQPSSSRALPPLSVRTSVVRSAWYCRVSASRVRRLASCRTQCCSTSSTISSNRRRALCPRRPGSRSAWSSKEVLHGAKSGESLTLNGAHPILHGVGR